MQNKYLLLRSVVAILLLAGFGCAPNETQQDLDDSNNPSVVENEDEDVMDKKDGEAMDKDSEAIEAMEKDGDAMEKSEADESVSSASTPGMFTDYDAAKLANANDGSVVLFFHASWCPSCRALESNINANLNNIPNGVTILKTDFDSQTDLKRKYGVTLQHTIVQVDADGNLIKKWSGGSTLSSIVEEIES